LLQVLTSFVVGDFVLPILSSLFCLPILSSLFCPHPLTDAEPKFVVNSFPATFHRNDNNNPLSRNTNKFKKEKGKEDESNLNDSSMSNPLSIFMSILLIISLS
jgi:hypothetical protein